MAVLLDAKSTAVSIDSDGNSTADHTNLTVGSGANRALVCAVNFDNATSNITAVWDQGGTNQAMTEIGNLIGGGSNIHTYLFGLVAPTSGNKTLRVTTDNPGGAFTIYCWAFTGVDQTGSATSFPHFTTDTKNGTTGNASLAVTSATGNYTVAMFAHGDSSANIGTRTPTADFFDTSGPVNNMAGQSQSGAATATFTVVLSSTNRYGYVGTDILASVAAATPVTIDALMFGSGL